MLKIYKTNNLLTKPLIINVSILVYNASILVYITNHNLDTAAIYSRYDTYRVTANTVTAVLCQGHYRNIIIAY